MSALPVMFIALFMQSASLDGTVTKAGTSERVGKAIIELRTADPGDRVQYTVTTKDDGKFSFQNVTPGRYRIAANRQGYVRSEYGQRKATGRGTPVDITAGQSVRDIKIQLLPTSVITGRIYDTSGKPVVKADVRALKPAYQNGRRTLAAVRSVLTNDLGEYRLFGLAPGDYYLGAVMPDWGRLGEQQLVNPGASGAGGAVFSARFGNLSPDGDPLAPARLQPEASSARYQTVYFPNTTDDQAAQIVELKAGSTVTGIDVLLSPVRTRRIRGVVIDGETGQPPKLQSPQPAQILVSPGTTGPGTPFANVTTGAFDTQALQAPTLITGILGPKSGRVALPFGDTDIDNLQVVLAAGYSMPGQITIEGSQPGTTDPRLTSFRVTVRSEPATAFTPGAPPDSGTTSNVGAFTLQNVIAGDFRVNVTPILSVGPGAVPPIPAALQKLYVKSIQYGDSDVLNSLLHIDGQPNQPLVIVVGTNAGSVTGSATDQNQQPANDATIVMVPANRTRIDLFRSATTDASGKFTLDRIPPGDYKAFAWDDVITGAWSDAQFMKAYEDRGTPVRIAEGDKQDIRLAVIPGPN